MSIKERGIVMKSIVRKAVLRLMNEYANQLGTEQKTKQDDCVREIYRYQSQINWLTIALNLVVFGRYDEVVRQLQSKLHIVKKIPTNKEEHDDLIKTIEALIRSKEIKLKEENDRYERLTETQEPEKSPRSIFIENIRIFNKTLELPYRLTLDITLSEYIGYSKDYEQLVKKIMFENGKKNFK
ncbi:hypothetical protein D0T49_04280 [Paludibacter sp. 221]|nr:hypothetical protein [Paludibacter sp. 221]